MRCELGAEVGTDPTCLPRLRPLGLAFESPDDAALFITDISDGVVERYNTHLGGTALLMRMQFNIMHLHNLSFTSQPPGPPLAWSTVCGY